MFIAFEGGEGSGKSTQARLLAEQLRSFGREAVLTFEPGGTEPGRAIRSIVLGTETGHLAPRAEALLFAADRAHHVATVVRPALERGAVVLTDRYRDSSIAYQGAGRELSPAEVQWLSEWATEGLVPDLTVLLDVDPELGLSRAGRQPDRLESEPLEFHATVRRHFLDLAAAHPARYLVLDAAAPKELLAEQIAARVQAVLR